MVMMCLSHSLLFADEIKSDELGRSLANYQVCSLISSEIKDQKMHVYYQSMLNDVGLSVLSLQAESAKQVYESWQKSEDVLIKISQQNLKQICLSRFDQLSRQMVN
jgi:hypothetical protein